MKTAASLSLDSSTLKKHQIFGLVCTMMLLCYPLYWAWVRGAFSFYFIWPGLFLFIALFVTFQASKESPPAKWFTAASFQLAWIVACYLVWLVSFAGGWLGLYQFGVISWVVSAIYIAYLATLPGVISLFPKCWTIAVPSWLLGHWFYYWAAC
jgi:hypothetical protein